MFIEVTLLIVAFLAVWLSTGLAIESIEKLSAHSKLSKLTLSLFVIGAVTSLPEMAITANALLLNSPQVALGNLIGSQVFLLFVVIPVLAIVSKGLQLHLQMKNISLVLTLLVALVPILALLNQSVDLGEVLIVVGVYLVFALTFFRQQTLRERVAERIHLPEKTAPWWEISKLLAALSILFLATNTAVKEMIELSALFHTPRFLLSLLILPVGTNLPELSLALGSLAAGKKNLALADYMGALTFNSLLIALLALSVGGSILIGQNISLVIYGFVAGLVIFWWCCFSRELLSIKEGLLLLLVYVTVLLIAIWQVMSGILG